MLRKIKRSIARHNMAMKGISLFGKYTVVEANGKKRKDTKSFFARKWREYL